MPTPEQQPPIEATTGRSEQEQHFKTIAVRVEESLHAQLTFIAQLSGTSLTEEIRTAIQRRIATAQDDPELVARAKAAQAHIEREAAARTAAIAGFMGEQAVSTSVSRASRRTKSTDQ